MKNLYYLLAFITVMSVGCKPLSNVYNDLDSAPAPKTLTLALTTAYRSNDDAKTNIPTILNTKYGDYPNGSTATVSFALPTSVPLVADSLYAHVAYTLVTADYTFPGNTFADLSDAGIINYLNYKYPTPAANQLAVLTYVWFLSGASASSGTTVTDSFLFINGLWTKIYTVSPVQYTSVNRGVNFNFIAADLPNLPSYFNAFLQNDPAVMATAKIGDIKYISYKYLTTNQKVLPLMYNGTNWVDRSSLNFLKLNGTWVPDPTVFVNIPATANNADYTYLNTITTISNSVARGNLAQFGDFNVQTGSQYFWSDADIAAGLAAILLHKISSPIIGIPYKVTYYIYTGSTSAATKIFIYNGTAFVAQ